VKGSGPLLKREIRKEKEEKKKKRIIKSNLNIANYE